MLGFQCKSLLAWFDSGAFISLAPVSLAQILGLNLTNGTPITLEGVGGSQLTAYVHSLNIVVGTDTYNGVTVAIANTENVPFLLGRVNFWDMATINIDDTARQICFTQISTGPPAQTSPPGNNATVYTYDLPLLLGVYAVAGLILYSGWGSLSGKHKKHGY